MIVLLIRSTRSGLIIKYSWSYRIRLHFKHEQYQILNICLYVRTLFMCHLKCRLHIIVMCRMAISNAISKMKVRCRTFFRNRILTNVFMSTPSDSEGQGRSARSKGFCVSKSFRRSAEKGVGYADHIEGASASEMCRPPLCSFLLFLQILYI